MKKVLIIEDDQVTRNLHTRVLEGSGCCVVSTDNGPDGIVSALRERPNLIVLDLGLPSPKPGAVQFNGLSVMQWLKRSPTTTGIPVVVATAWATDGIRQKCTELGADAFLTKPIQPEALRSTARILMDDN